MQDQDNSNQPVQVKEMSDSVENKSEEFLIHMSRMTEVNGTSRKVSSFILRDSDTTGTWLWAKENDHLRLDSITISGK